MKGFAVIIIQFAFFVHAKGQWQRLKAETTASFRSLAVPSKKIIWAGGSGGTVLRSVDSGKHWEVFKVGDKRLDFRAIAATGAMVALAMSAGLAEDNLAKVYKTTDGGKSWYEVFSTNESGVFLDGMYFIDRKHGFVFGDPIHSKAYVLETTDGGENWIRMGQFPDLKEGEASFAASNSGMVHIKDKIWYAFQSRMLVSEDCGKNWKLHDTKFPNGETNGIFGVFFWNRSMGILLGGDYKNDKERQTNMATTNDGGKNWQAKVIVPDGLKESACKAGKFLVALGPSGTAISKDEAMTWIAVASESFHVVRSKGRRLYAAGAEGRLATAKVRQLLRNKKMSAH